jgi:hypothetical protein
VQARVGESGRYLKARRFLVEPLEALTDQALFIDALDEKRGGRYDHWLRHSLETEQPRSPVTRQRWGHPLVGGHPLQKAGAR